MFAQTLRNVISMFLQRQDTKPLEVSPPELSAEEKAAVLQMYQMPQDTNQSVLQAMGRETVHLEV